MPKKRVTRHGHTRRKPTGGSTLVRTHQLTVHPRPRRWRPPKSWTGLERRIGKPRNKNVRYYSGAYRNWDADTNKQATPPSPAEQARMKNEALRVQEALIKDLYHEATAEEKARKDKELLEITVLAAKLPHFDFLRQNVPEVKVSGQGRTTQYEASGDWTNEKGDEFPAEENVVISVEFYETEGEAKGKRLITNLNRYNDLVVGEQMLYSRTAQLSESSLSQETLE
jgi:translation initiation factor 2 beta subunit (eIF-2beta)/eIF-5